MNQRFLEVYFKVLLQGVKCKSSSRGRQRLKSLTVLQYIYKSIMGGYSGVRGQHWGMCLQVKVGEGHVSGRGSSYGRFWIPKWWIGDVYSLTWGRKDVCKGAKGICS